MATLMKKTKEEEMKRLSDEALDQVAGRGMMCPDCPLPTTPEPFRPKEADSELNPPEVLLPPQ